MRGTNSEDYLNQKLKDANERVDHDLEEVEAAGGYSKEYNGRESLSELDVHDSVAISQIYNILVRNKQWDDKCPSGGKFVNRLVRTKAWIDPIDVHHHKEAGDMPEQIFCSGAFLDLEVYYVPMSSVVRTKQYDPRQGEYLDCYSVKVEDIGTKLPSSSEVSYSTFRPYTSTYGLCLALRGGQAWLREFLNRSIHWEYVECE